MIEFEYDASENGAMAWRTRKYSMNDGWNKGWFSCTRKTLDS